MSCHMGIYERDRTCFVYFILEKKADATLLQSGRYEGQVFCKKYAAASTSIPS